MFEPATGERVAVTSQNPGSPFASSIHRPVAVGPRTAGGAAAQRSAPAIAGKLAGLGPSAVCEVQAAASAASAAVASNLIADPFDDFVLPSSSLSHPREGGDPEPPDTVLAALGPRLRGGAGLVEN